MDTSDSPKPSARTQIVSATVAAALLIAGLAVALRTEPLIPGSPWWWLLVAVGFFLAESLVIHFEGKRETLSLSLVELPLAVGVVYLASPALIAARLLGSGLSLALIRRSRGLKLAYNFAVVGAETAAASLLLTLLLSSPPRTALEWAAVVAVVTTASVGFGFITGLTVAWADRRQADDLTRNLLFQLAFAISAAALGVTVVRLSMESAPLGLFPLIAVVGLYLTFRASVRATQQLDDLENLVGVTSKVDQDELADGFITSLLGRTRELMRAERAILVIEQNENDYVEYEVTDGGRTVSRQPLEPAEFEPLGKLRGPTRLDALSPVLARRGINEAIVTPVHVGSESSSVGVLIIADRTGASGSFDGMAMRMAASLVNHLAINLHNVLLLQRMADHQLTDTMTHLPTRTVLEQQMATSLARPDQTAAVFVIDLTRFRDFNDAFGHTRGDELIVEVARRLRTAVGRDDIVARLGGDEFGILLPGRSAAEVPEVARRISEAIERPVLVEGTPLVMSCTMGVSVAPHDGVDPEVLLTRADTALHVARQSNVDWQRYDPERDPSSPDRLRLAHDLRTAILAGQIEVWFQPILTSVRYELIQVEALLRWTHPRLGPQPPEQVVDLARQWGLGRQLTSLVLEQSIRQAAAWHDAGLPVAMSVNLSAQDIADADIVDVIDSCLRRHRLDARHLQVELTETSLLSDPERSGGILQRISSLGVRTAVDDFGTGYSSLSYLRQLPIDALKIDRSFVIPLREGDREEVIVRSIIELGHALELSVVAEGVEDAETAELLVRMGCDMLQGYVFGRPSPASVVEESLRVRAP